MEYKEDSDADGPTKSRIEIERSRTRDSGIMDASTDQRSSIGATRADHFAVRKREEQQ